MASLHQDMLEYNRQMEIGTIQRAYRGLMDFMLAMKAQFRNQHSDFFVSGALYPGYMDMTYFSVISPRLKERDLKVAIVFLHHICRFEAWLAGVNKRVQAKYWYMIKESGWDQYRLVPDPKNTDAIMEHTLTDHPDFDDLDALTERIMSGTLTFMQEVGDFLDQAHPRS